MMLPMREACEFGALVCARRCVMSSIFKTKDWAQDNFGQCDLGDARRTARLVSMAEKTIRNPSGSLPNQMEEVADTKAAYRLFDSKGATFRATAEPHWKRTRAAAKGLTLVICDTTELDFGSHREIEGLGPTGNGSGRGFLLHNAIMVDPSDTSILGVAGQTIHHRKHKEKTKKKETRMESLNRQRESEVWGTVIDDVGEPQAGAEYVCVCDRGADNFEVLCHLQQQKSGWLIRVKSKNRKVLTADGESIRLSKYLTTLPVLGSYELSLRSTRNEESRIATLEVLSGRVCVPMPRHKSPYVKSLSPNPIETNILWVREVNAPKGVKPIEWVFYTSEPVDTFEKAWVVIEHYEMRWLVEEYHKALKSGCRVKERQLKTSSRLEAMIGLNSVVAVALLQMKSLARATPNRPASSVVPKLWLAMLKAVRPKVKRVFDMTIRDFYREVAKLGGFFGRKSDGEPGWITIWRGWGKLNELVLGAQIAIETGLIEK